MKNEVVIHMDETPFKVIDEEKKNSYFWVTRTTKEFSQRQLAMFSYYNSRSGKTIEQIVGQNYDGTIMCDGYSSRLYPQAKFGSCFVHIRREFHKIIKSNEVGLRYSHAMRVLELMQPIFYQENRLQYIAPEEKCQQRRLIIRPLMNRLYDYLSKIRLPQGNLRKAIANALRLKDRVYRIFDNG